MYFLDGSILNGQDVYVLFASGNTNYILAKSGNSYVVSSDVIDSRGVNPGSLYIPTFTISVIDYPNLSTNGPVTYRLKDTVAYYLTYDSANQTLVSNPQQNNNNICSSKQSNYQSWRAPSAFLAGAQYSLTIGGVSPILPIAGQVNQLDISTVDTYFVPTNWYQKGECAKSASGNDALVYHYCYVTDDKLFKCADVPIGWTLMSDCTLGLYYPYCTPGFYCSAQCKSPCSKSSNDCQWNTKTETFQCNLTIGNLANTPWWRSYWFLAILALIIIILLLTLVFIPLARNRDHDKKGEFYDDRLGEVKVESYKNRNS